MPLEIRGARILIRSAQLVRGTRLEYALTHTAARRALKITVSVGVAAAPFTVYRVGQKSETANSCSSVCF